jgi:hypothetical protein
MQRVKGCPKNEEVKVLKLIRKKKSSAEPAKNEGKDKSPTHETVKEKEIPASFAVIPQTEKILAIKFDKSLVNMEKALYLCVLKYIYI